MQRSTSESISNIINKSITDTLIGNSQNCSQSNSSSQKLNISKIKTKGCPITISDISQNSVSIPNFSCYSESLNSLNFKNDLQNAVKQNAKSETSGLVGAFWSESYSSTINNNITDIETNLNLQNLSKCIQDNTAEQTLDINNIEVDCSPCYGDFCKTYPTSELCTFCKGGVSINNISQKILQNAVGKCIGKNTNIQDTITKIANQVDQVTSSKATGIDFSFIAVIVIICGLILVVFFYNGSQTVTKLLTNPYFLLATGVLITSVYYYITSKKDDQKSSNDTKNN